MRKISISQIMIYFAYILEISGTHSCGQCQRSILNCWTKFPERGPYNVPAQSPHVRFSLTPYRKKMNQAAFGAWAQLSEDGLAYQERIRDEW